MIYKFIKERNLEKLKDHLQNNPQELNILSEDGISPIAYAVEEYSDEDDQETPWEKEEIIAYSYLSKG